MGQARGEELPKRIGIIGDVHTEFAQLELAIERLQVLGADKLVCVGDIVDGPEEAWGADQACLLLQRHNVVTVCGNHDRWLLEGTMRDLSDALESAELESESLEYLQALPAMQCLRTAGGDMLLCHGLGRDDMASLSATLLSPRDPNSQIALQQVMAGGYRFVVSGHTHQAGVRTVERTLFINAGTLHRRYDQVFSMLDVEAGEVLYYSLGDGESGGPVDKLSWKSQAAQPAAQP